MNQLNIFDAKQLSVFADLNTGYAIDPDLKECCMDYIGENSEDGLILHEDYNGVEACERYLNGKSDFKEIAALYKFFGIKQ